jgi:hypothetical protein
MYYYGNDCPGGGQGLTTYREDESGGIEDPYRIKVDLSLLNMNPI